MRGAKTKAEFAAQGEDAPTPWLTGRAYCLTFGGPMEGVSGTSKTGRTYWHHYCPNQRKMKYSAKTLRKDEIDLRLTMPRVVALPTAHSAATALATGAEVPDELPVPDEMASDM